MFRAIALAITLTLATGPTAAQMCKAMCPSQSAATSECHHDASKGQTSVTTDRDCDRAALNIGAFLRTEVARQGAASDGARAVHVPCYQVSHVATKGQSWQQAVPDWSLARRPLTTTLRI